MPEWATPNRIDLELDTLRLRDFSRYGSAPISTPVLIDPPYAGHSSSLADYAKGQSLVETLRTAGHDRVFVMDWKGATSEMKDYGRGRGSTSGRHPAFRHCHEYDAWRPYRAVHGFENVGRSVAPPLAIG